MSKKRVILGRDSILAAQDIKIELVNVPEWGGAVYVRGLTGAERAEYEMGLVEMKGGKVVKVNSTDSYPRLALCCCVDSDDPATAQRLFNDADLDALRQKSGAPLARIAKVALRLSGMGRQAEETLEQDFLAMELNGSGSA